MKSLESRLLQYERLADDSIAFLRVLLLILNRGKFKLSTSHAFEIRIFDGCYGDDIWKFTSFDIAPVDVQTAFDKVNDWFTPVSFNLSANTLVTKVESEQLLGRALTLTDPVPYDTYIGKPVDKSLLHWIYY